MSKMFPVSMHTFIDRDQIIKVVLEMLQFLDKEERFTIIDDNFCKVCFGDKPCYCAPRFDD